MFQGAHFVIIKGNGIGVVLHNNGGQIFGFDVGFGGGEVLFYFLIEGLEIFS